jgi:DNA-binding protein
MFHMFINNGDNCMELPMAPVERLIKRAGAERVSDGAVEELADYLEEEVIKIASNAIKLSKHAGRKTVTRDDIKLALNTVRR